MLQIAELGLQSLQYLKVLHFAPIVRTMMILKR